MQVRAEKSMQYYLILNFQDERELMGGRLCMALVADTWDQLVRDAAAYLKDMEPGESLEYTIYTRNILTLDGDQYICETNYQDITSIHPKFLETVKASPAFQKK